MEDPDKTIGDIGELGLLRLMREVIDDAGAPLPRGWLGIGDDTAALPTPPAGHELLLTVDAVVEGVHFDRAWAPARLVGRKAMAVNLSDIAAMGGTPTAALLALSLPADLPLWWLLELARGAAQRAATHGCVIVGGNLAAGPVVNATVTVAGVVEHGRLARRRGARAGDRIFVTGRLGSAAAGLRALIAGEGLGELASSHAAAPIDDAAREVPGTYGELALAVLAQLDPVPRVSAGRAVAPFVSAMIDLSDGLCRDVGHLAAASDLVAAIDVDRVPRLSFVGAAAALQGGEDYQLCCAVSLLKCAEFEEEAASRGIDFSAVGQLRARRAQDPLHVHVFDSNGAPLQLEGAFEHFR